MKTFISFFIFSVISCANVFAGADSNGPAGAVSIVGNSSRGRFSVTYTQDPDRLEEVREFLSDVKAGASNTTMGVVTTDSVDSADFLASLPQIKKMGKDHAPDFMLLDEEALGINDRNPAAAQVETNAKGSKSSTLRQGIIFATFQSAISTFYWIHYSTSPHLLPVIVAAMINTLQNYYFTINSTLWARATDMSTVKMAEHLGLSRLKNSEYYRIWAQLGLSTIGNLVTSGIYRGILNPHIFLTHSLGFLKDAVGYALTQSYVASTYDTAVSHWSRVWAKAGDPALSQKEVSVLMMARNVVLSALLPLLFKNTFDVVGLAKGVIHGTPLPVMSPTAIASWTIAIGAGTFGAFMIGKGDSFFRWVKAQPFFERAVDLGAAIEKIYNEKTATILKRIRLEVDCRKPLEFQN